LRYLSHKSAAEDEAVSGTHEIASVYDYISAQYSSGFDRHIAGPNPHYGSAFHERAIQPGC
jgi:hypothetical protein